MIGRLLRLIAGLCIIASVVCWIAISPTDQVPTKVTISSYLMAKLAVRPYPWGASYRFHCPGCGHGHVYDSRNDGGHPSWSFNGDLDRPTFTPSLLNRVGPMPTVPEGRPDAGKTHVCHLFLTDGKIQFLNDCSHSLAGKTVDLQEID